MEKAIQYGMAALLMDLADVGGNVKDGCHIASMGGTWMMLTYGFGGMRDHDGTLSSGHVAHLRRTPSCDFP
jgi:Trehalose and maltose hydrolases (possible phosphorylases)